MQGLGAAVSGIPTGQGVKPLDDGCAANDEFQSIGGGSYRGELFRDLLRQRVRMPEPQKGAMARPHLSQRIIKAISSGNILFVEAPPGFGKSQTVCCALHENDQPWDQPGWITLTAQENDPGRLLTLLEIALVPSSKDRPQGLQNAGSFLDALAMMLSAQSLSAGDQPQVLVIDNVDTIAHPASIGLLQQLVLDTPRNLGLVMISRKPLPFEIHSQQLSGRFKRLGPEDLELTRQETFDFFAESLASQALTSLTVEHLFSMTDGWIMPLGLYQREFLETPETRLPIQESSSVKRFLRDSVLTPLTPGQQRSLRMMAELEIVSDELFLALADASCDHVFRPSVAAESGLPLRPLPGRGRWYGFNSLVQEWLRMPALKGAETRALKASRWFSHRGQIPEALRYALIADAHEEAIRIASDASEALLVGQDTASLLALRNNLPDELFDQSPRLRIVYGWVHAIGGQFSQARLLIAGLGKNPENLLQGRVYALQAFILRGEGAVTEALEVSGKALASSELSAQVRLVTELVRSSALCAQGNFSEARIANRNAVRLAREAGDGGSEALAVYAHARIEIGKGALKHAEQLLRTGLDMWINEGARQARVGEVRLQLHLVMVLWHQGRENEADRLLVTCTRHAEQARDLGLLLAFGLRVLICRAHDHLDEAFTWIGRAERTMQAWKVDTSVYVPVLDALKSSTWLASGQVEAAAQALERLASWRAGNRVPDMFPMMPGLLDCLQARLEMANRDDKQAAETLGAIRGKHDEMVPFGLELHARLLESVISWRQQGAVAGKRALSSAIALAAEEHYISPFLELKRELQPLFEKVWAQLPESSFITEIGRLYGIGASPEAGNFALAEPISEREKGVLELIARGFSNQDIADKLHISLHTVKTHARRINAKLEVKSRTQATVRARELGIL